MCEYENSLNLQLAWNRLKNDKRKRCFITHPFIIQLIENDLENWFYFINNRVANGYNPSPAVICYEPKPGWLLRPGCSLHVDDELVYTAILGSLFPCIEQSVRWSQGTTDTSYVLKTDYNSIEWVKSGFLAWKDFRIKSLELVKKHEFVVTIDIAAFYENIDIPRLISDVRNLLTDNVIIDQLSSCLNRWAEPRGKGIPQGYTASDILAKLYLNPIDQAIKDAGFNHLRYVDDIRVFCSSLHEAKEILHIIIDRLRLRGLNVQSAKSKILRSDKAIIEIDGINPLIFRLNQELAQELVDFGVSNDYSFSLDDLTRIFTDNNVVAPVGLLNRAFKSHFIESDDAEFNSTLFHFLLTRLGLAKSDVAIEYCLNLILRRPEETRFILKYFHDVSYSSLIVNHLINCLQANEMSNHYQVYQILKCFYEENIHNDQILLIVRCFIHNRNNPQWLRSYAYAILGKFGNIADLENLISIYPEAESSIERSDIICGLKNYELSRRNSIYARMTNDGLLEKMAVNFVKQGLV